MFRTAQILKCQLRYIYILSGIRHDGTCLCSVFYDSDSCASMLSLFYICLLTVCACDLSDSNATLLLTKFCNGRNYIIYSKHGIFVMVLFLFFLRTNLSRSVFCVTKRLIPVKWPCDGEILYQGYCSNNTAMLALWLHGWECQLVDHSVCQTLLSRLKYLDNYWMDRHEIWYCPKKF